MKYLFYLAIILFANLTLSVVPTGKIIAQPINQTERSLGLEPKIERYIYSESFGGSDSAWINLNKRTRVFNESNQIELFFQMKWDSIDWQDEMMWTYDYTGNLLTTLNTLSWGEDGRQDSGRSEFVYDDEQRIILNSNYYKNDEGEWLNASETSTSYNESGRVSEIIVYRNQGYMADTSKSIYTYDVDGNLIELLNQKFQNGEWKNQNITVFAYENSNIIFQENKFWYGTELYSDFMDSLFYDEFGKRTSRIHYKFYDGEYNNDFRYIWTYDENDRIIEEVYQNWEAIDWADPAKTTFTYDEAGNVTERHKMQFRNNAWLNKEISNLTYDTYNQLTEYAYYIWVIDDWLRNVRFTYEHAAVGIDDFTSSNTQTINYPNPFSDETTIQFALEEAGNVNITIYDINGKPVTSKKLTGLSSGEQQYRFNSGNLPSGIYLYRIDIGSEQYFNSFVITK
ncbi:MAG: T9SS type A sorting domain-containing protein [bacterium]